jgi:GNAT superfamily N-acetyltransferase
MITMASVPQADSEERRALRPDTAAVSLEHGQCGHCGASIYRVKGFDSWVSNQGGKSDCSHQPIISSTGDRVSLGAVSARTKAEALEAAAIHFRVQVRNAGHATEDMAWDAIARATDGSEPYKISANEVLQHAKKMGGRTPEFSSDEKSPLDYYGAPVHRDSLTQGSEHGKGYFSAEKGAKPGTKAFVDWQKAGPDAHYVHYMAVHPDHRGQGLAHHVVEQHIQAHPGLKELDFGKLMEPEMQSVVDRVKKNHPDINVRSKVYYR